MMTFFPIPYEDELLYSILARYRIYSGNISLKSTLDDVFGNRNVAAVMDLPSHIDKIIVNMPMGSKYSSEELIEKYTLYPFYTAFLPPESAEKIKEYMIGDKGGSIYNKVGLMASSISLNQYFKFCPQCIKEDMKRYGELYWHRVHQVPGVLVCPRHKNPLYDSQVPVRGFNKHEYINASLDACKINNEVFNYTDKVLEQVINLSEDVDILLNQTFPNKSLDWFREQYINRLKVLGYANINGNVRQKKLLTDFVDYYGDYLLIILQSGININSEHTWLTDIFRKKSKTTHPIRHLLVMRFLNISIEELFSNRLEYKPFGNGPWPCLNPAAEHYREMKIQNLKIKYGSDSKSPLGIFECSCGFSYMRTGSDTEESDKYKTTKIITFGPVWENKLRELTENKLSLRETARILQVDPATVKKYAKRLGLTTYWEERSQVTYNIVNIAEDIISNNDNQKNYRERWLELVKQYSEKSKTELRNIDKKVYIWLYRNDKEWLNEYSPESKTTFNVNLRVDWNARDNDILTNVEKAVNDLINTADKPKRVTIGTIGSNIGLRSLLEKHISKLPKTKAFLENVVESVRDYQIRRIKYAIKELQEQGHDLQLWKIYRRAAIRKEYQDGLESIILELINNVESN
ncbi:TnsD family transposase [Clostridium kluyveri]|uniref:TnsD family transposase n=1 Tax=Clostridium kluyveri TaxID=1534 RepID=UPI002247F60C|nr:TnsD family transposase [Clostridium kluyveri]UZQ52428.1 TnsD family transposase [Clostridium kluyveri]